MVSLAAASALLWQPALRTVSLVVDGESRTMLAHVPAQPESAPAVIVFHGHGGSSKNAARQFNIHSLWPEAIVVYPQGQTGVKGITDPEGKKTGWQKGKGDMDDRDVKFTGKILDWITRQGHEGKMFVTGHSNGSQFAWVAAAAYPTKFSGVAGVCAPSFESVKGLPNAPVMTVAGKNDPIVPFRGMALFADALKARFECKGDGTAQKDGSTAYEGSQKVVVYHYEGGHSFPKAVPGMIVDFFKQVR